MSSSASLSKMVEFGDLEGSEAKLRERLLSASGLEKLEIETQISRVMGLKGNYSGALELLGQIREQLPVEISQAQVRVELETGRCYRDEHRHEEAIQCFEDALEHALAIKDDYLAMDAAHMVAIAGDAAHQMEAGERALKLIERVEDEEAKYWIGPIINNLGWTYFDSKQYDRALELFEHSVEVRSAGPKRPYLIARYTVAKTLREMGRYEEALAQLSEILEENRQEGFDAPFANEEMAECLYAVGRIEESKPFFALAFEGLSKIPYIAKGEPERLKRLEELSI